MLAAQERLRKEKEELGILFDAKDVEIVFLKPQIQKLSSKGSYTFDELATENVKIRRRVDELVGEIQEQNREVKDLTKKLLVTLNAGNSRVEMLL